MTYPSRDVRFLLPLTLVLACAAGCARPDDRLGADLRARLSQPESLTPDDLTGFVDEVQRGIDGRAVGIRTADGSTPLTREQHAIVLGMLTDRAGLFDEGLRDVGGRPLRVLNAPGVSTNSEYSATRRLLVDIATLEPVRFEFTDDASIEASYGYDLTIER